MQHQRSYFTLYWSHCVEDELSHNRHETFLDQFSSYPRTGEVIEVTSHPLWTPATGWACLWWGCYDDNFLRSRMNGITQEEASRFKSAPEVFKVHRLPGHLQSKSVLLTLTHRSAVHARKLASYVTSNLIRNTKWSGYANPRPRFQTSLSLLQNDLKGYNF